MASSDDLNDFGIAIGDVLDERYLVEGVIGQGGMGVVLAVRHASLHHELALKLLSPRALGTPQAEERFFREGRTVAKLSSDHVARVFDVGRANGVPYFVMERLYGEDLRSRIDRQGPQSLECALDWTIQALAALKYAHKNGIVHRDVKPANLFLAERPRKKPIVKLIDFGIARPSFGFSRLTRTGKLMGSPVYMAPEQTRAKKSVDSRVDIWAIGVSLYEMLTGALPFSGDSLGFVLDQILYGAPTPPSVLRPELPAEIDAVVLKCLEKEPRDRFQSASELARALSAIPRSARNVVLSPRPGKEIRLRPTDNREPNGFEITPLEPTLASA